MIANHVVPKKTYYLIGASLLGLLALTVVAALIDLGPFNVIIALLIAAAKMMLVVLYFMHVKFNSRMVWVFASGGVVWFLIMIILTMGDYIGRR